MRISAPPAPGSRPRCIAVAGGVAAVAVALIAPTAAAAGPLSSWSVAPSQFFQDTYGASRTTNANGRAWQLSFGSGSRAVLLSRRLSDGHANRVSVTVPRPAGSELESDSFDGNDTDAQLFIAGRRGFASGAWCLERDEDGESCIDDRAFYVEFSTRTGHVLRQALTRPRRVLIGGSRISYVARPARGSTVIRDAITDKTVRRLPHQARDVQGAGPYISYKDPDAYERRNGDPADTIGPDWTVLHVRARVSGRTLYRVSHNALRKKIQPRGAVSVQQARLTPDGSQVLAVDMNPKRAFRPVVIDRHGKILYASETSMRRPNQYASEIQGNRILVNVDTNGDGRCGPTTGWLTNIGGHAGNAFRTLPHSPKHRISQAPGFDTPTTMTWLETIAGKSYAERYRVRVGHDLRTLPLTRTERPRC